MLYLGFNILPRSVVRRQTLFAARITRTLCILNMNKDANSWMQDLKSTMYGRPPEISAIAISQSRSRNVARIYHRGHMGLLLVVEQVIRESFNGSTTRMNLGLNSVARKVQVGNNKCLILRLSPQGTFLQNLSLFPPFASRKSRIANQLVIDIAETTQELTQSSDCPSFGDENPVLVSTPNEFGWVKCPGCNKKFMLTDGNMWDGQRHYGCGQRIQLQTTDA